MERVPNWRKPLEPVVILEKWLSVRFFQISGHLYSHRNKWIKRQSNEPIKNKEKVREVCQVLTHRVKTIKYKKNIKLTAGLLSVSNYQMKRGWNDHCIGEVFNVVGWSTNNTKEKRLSANSLRTFGQFVTDVCRVSDTFITDAARKAPRRLSDRQLYKSQTPEDKEQ